MPRGRPRPPVVERFTAYTLGTPPGCVEWQGRINLDGYGLFWLRPNNVGAHRAAWLLFVGEIPKGMDVHHMCRNRPCVNPMHLTLLTHAEHASERRRCRCGTCPSCLRRAYANEYRTRPHVLERERRANRAYSSRKWANYKKERTA
jgi:hypothetical protein